MTESLKLKHHIFLFSALFVLWLLLTASLKPEEILTGIVVALIVSLMSAPYLSILDGLRYHPIALLSVFSYLGFFFIALVKANFDLARRVLSPSLPIDPTVVEVETSLESELGRILLANSITLTPGTLAVDMIGSKIIVHWVAIPEGVALQQATLDITQGFEKHISGFLK